ncbi:MAG: esterase YqiA [Paraglaciecola sp.]|nr:esterase YqiA [Paraglaciecola sp.]NCT46938.1 esterase YqiA [Paraglaciecola sp.]
MDKNSVVVYLHGFLSSPQSLKAQQTLAYAQQHWPQIQLEIPALCNHPQAAIDMIESLLRQFVGRPVHFIGSSMGGYFSTYFTQRQGGKAVLINPAVKPYELLADYLGDHLNPYTGENFSLDQRHVEELLCLDTPLIEQPQRYWVLLQRGDETLDYRLAETKYHGAKFTIEDDGDHSFQGFERFLPDIFRFLLQD